MLKNCFGAVCLVVLLSGICAAGSGDVKWTGQYQAGVNGTATGMACLGNQVYATGFYYGPTGASAGSYTALVAYNATKGNVVWSDAGETGLTGPIKAVGNRIYTAGMRTTTESSVTQDHLFVNAYDTQGHVVWERYWLDSGQRTVNDLNMVSNKVVTAGTDSSSNFAVTALSASNGNVLWENAQGAGSAEAVAISGGRVFAAGNLADYTNYRERFAVRAYNLSTGSLLWEDAQGTAGTSATYNNSNALAIAATGSRVYVAGLLYSDDNEGGGSAFAVRCYDAKTGGLMWKDYYDFYSYFDDAAYVIQLLGNKLFVGGYVTRPGGGQAFAVRAYNAGNGTVLWTTLSGGYDLEQNSVQALVASGNALYAAGATTQDYYTGFGTKGYNMNKGTVLWESYIDSQAAGTQALAPMATAICANGNNVFSGGTSSVADAGQAFTVRANSR